MLEVQVNMEINSGEHSIEINCSRLFISIILTALNYICILPINS